MKPPEPRPTLLTGCTGFVGRHVGREMRRRGLTFVAMARAAHKASWYLDQGVEVRLGSIEEPGACRAAATGCGVVLHLAAAADVSDAGVNESVNLHGLAALLDACRAARVQRFVFVSSTCAGRSQRDAYGETKRLGEDLVRGSGLDFVILRPTMIYGRGSKEFDLFVNVVARSPVVPIIGTGRNVIQPVYLGDAVEALVNVAAGAGSMGATYDLAGPAPVTFDDFVQLVARALGRRRRRIVHVPAGPALVAARLLGRMVTHVPLTVDQVMAFLQDTRVDVGPLERDLGLRPRTVAQGLSEALGGAVGEWGTR